MRTTLTVLFAVALTLAIGVPSASADTDLHVCKKKNGKQVRLVEDSLMDCTGGEDGEVWTAVGASEVSVLSNTTYYATVFYPQYGTLPCRIEDAEGDVFPSRRLAGQNEGVDCYPNAIKSWYVYPNGIGALCVDADWNNVPPYQLRITCAID